MHLTQKTIIVYVDGLNLYHTLQRFNPRLMWLDVVGLVENVLGGGYAIARVNYYTARFSSRNPISAGQQAVYHNALETRAEVTIHTGYFKRVPKWGETQSTWARLMKQERLPPLPPLPSVIKVTTREEKKTDVTLASHLVWDAANAAFEVAVIITNDGDFEEAIRVVVEKAKLPVYLLSPAILVRPRKSTSPQQLTGRPGAHIRLRKIATRTDHITENHLKSAQFPRIIKAGDGSRIIRPPAWD